MNTIEPDTLYDYPEVAQTPASARTRLLQEICEQAQNARMQLGDYADATQLAAWNDKAMRAQRVVNKKASKEDLAILAAETEERGLGEDAKTLAARQLEKAEARAIIIARIDGREKATLNEAESLSAIDALEALVERFSAQLADLSWRFHLRSQPYIFTK